MSNTPLMSPEQCRAARALLGLTQERLTNLSGVSTKIITNFERRRGEITTIMSLNRAMWTEQDLLTINILRRLQRFLEGYGVAFLFEKDEPRGVVLQNRSQIEVSEEEDVQSVWPLHYRIARAWLDWTATDLAKEAAVSESTVRDFDKGRRLPHRQNVAKMELAIKLHDVQFLFDVQHQPIGIWVRKGRRGFIAKAA